MSKPKFKIGDQVTRVGEGPISTIADMQWVVAANSWVYALETQGRGARIAFGEDTLTPYPPAEEWEECPGEHWSLCGGEHRAEARYGTQKYITFPPDLQFQRKST